MGEGPFLTQRSGIVFFLQFELKHESYHNIWVLKAIFQQSDFYDNLMKEMYLFLKKVIYEISCYCKPNANVVYATFSLFLIVTVIVIKVLIHEIILSLINFIVN